MTAEIHIMPDGEAAAPPVEAATIAEAVVEDEHARRHADHEARHDREREEIVALAAKIEALAVTDAGIEDRVEEAVEMAADAQETAEAAASTAEVAEIVAATTAEDVAEAEPEAEPEDVTAVVPAEPEPPAGATSEGRSLFRRIW